MFVGQDARRRGRDARECENDAIVHNALGRADLFGPQIGALYKLQPLILKMSKVVIVEI